MSLSFGFKTDVGRKRRSNQDQYVVVRGDSLNGELDALFLVADGMGGKAGGEVASGIVVHTLPDYITSRLAARNGDKSPVDAARLLQEGIALANRKVRERQNEEAELGSMGTTCVSAVLDANVLTIANVGDSRAYLQRDGILEQVTDDHSEVWEQVLAGNMTREQAQRSRFRNQITRAIGAGSDATPDIRTFELQEGDTVLLCSDGLTSEVADEEIAFLMAGVADAQEACERLVAAALANGGRDNITAIVLRYGKYTPRVLPRAAKPEAPMAAEVDAFENWEATAAGMRAARAGADDEGQDLRGLSKAGRRRSSSPLLWAALFLVCAAAGGEAYALFYLNRELKRVQSLPPVIAPLPPRPTDADLRYHDPVVVTPEAVRDAPLAVDDEGSLLAVSRQGRLVRIDKEGKISPASPTAEMPLKPDLHPAAPGLLLTIDPSGNRYQIAPGAAVISKYDAEGKPLHRDIGKGKLTRPTALTVDSAGNLYVVDAGHAKKLAAFGPPNL